MESAQVRTLLLDLKAGGSALPLKLSMHFLQQVKHGKRLGVRVLVFLKDTQDKRFSSLVGSVLPLTSCLHHAEHGEMLLMSMHMVH